MKSLLILIAACFGAISCTEHAPKTAEVDPVQVFVAAINEKGDLAFESWNGKLKGVDSDSILHFRKDSKVELEDRGIGIQYFRGSYALDPGGRITISLNGYNWKWPAMLLRHDGEDLVLYREDGVTTWPIEASNPDASIEGFWPFRESETEEPNKP
jgi:hypothetical protein